MGWTNLQERSLRNELGVSDLATLTTICRLCMMKGCISMEFISHVEIENCIAGKIAGVTQLTLFKGDGLPETVCQQCLIQLDTAHTFIQLCTQSDRSLRSMLTQGVPEVMACKDDGSISRLTSTDQSSQLLISNELLTPSHTDNTVAHDTVQDPEIFLTEDQPIKIEVSDVAPNFEIVHLEEYTMPEHLALESNLAEEDGKDSSVESTLLLSSESLYTHPLLLDPLQTCGVFKLDFKNASETASLGDTLQEICAIVALSNEEIPSKSNHLIKTESLDDPTNAEKGDFLACSLPEHGTQDDGLVLINSEDSFSTHMEDFVDFEAELKEESQEIKNASIVTEVAVKETEPVPHSNQKQSDKLAVKLKCPDCFTEYTNKKSLARHAEEILKHRQTSEAQNQLLKRQESCSSHDNLVSVTNEENSAFTYLPKVQRKTAGSSVVGSYSAHKEIGPPLLHRNEPLTSHRSSISVQLRKLKRILVVKLTRLPVQKTTQVISQVTKPKRAERKYKCAICSKDYLCKSYLALHFKNHERRMHPEEITFKCKQCGNTYKNLLGLNSHIQRHTAKRIFQCERCKASFFTRGHLKRHSEIHTNVKAHKCQTCGKAFNEAYSLRNHILTHSDEKPWKCEKCDRTFKLKSRLKGHLRSHEQPQKPKLWHRCFICLSDFLSEQRLADHVKIHKRTEVQVGLPNESLEPDKPIVSGTGLAAKFRMQNVEKSSKTATKDINKLQLTAKIGTKAVCPNESSKLLQATGSRKIFECNVCNLVCANKQHYEIHRKTHTREKRFQCNICEKRLSTAPILRTHMLIHTGKRPVYTCDICFKTVTQWSSLARHKLMHTGGEKRFTCALCQHACISKSALGIHERTHIDHRPYQCEHCDRSYREAYTFKLHMRIHNKEKTFKCSHCKMSFHRQEYLQRHLKIHEENRKMYSCDTCDKSYLRRRSITRHLKKYHVVL